MNNLLLFIMLVLMLWDNIYSQNSLKEISDISLSPVDAFEKYCARCHGYEGADYEKEFEELTEEKLKTFVEDMMFGPASLNPTGIEIEAMTTCNKSIQNKKPSAAALNSKSFLEGKDRNLIINISPGSEIYVSEKEKIKIEKEEKIWKLFYNYEKISKLKIIVKRNSVISSFIFPDELWCK